MCCAQNGSLVSVEASGHAGFASQGSDIVCAAVTILLRTAVSVLSSKNDIQIQVNFPERGFLAYTVTGYTKSSEPLLLFAAEFLQKGIESLVCEFPQAVHMQMNILKDT